MTGKIDKVHADKGFGWIYGEDKERYFFHKSDFNGHWNDLIVDSKLNKAIPVQFESGRTTKGPRASMVSRLDFPNQSVTENG